ncbi:ornithine cyclodeaminase family protein [Nesterenkonia ebinurensis]|uniref:ornithine cyclodeaminase family protein n=1 Tax=Nesterenkonia ebinurensis TaxID=2608252 RepID=UPI00123CC4C6|nr:ornithine cyclodeaminase family protein [Nesterenkonia ebinurensis]
MSQPESGAPLWIGVEEIAELMPMRAAVDALEETLVAGFDPEDDGERSRLTTPRGQMLQMPSASSAWCGTKVVTLRPGNEKVGLPVIQGVYLLFDGETHTPVATLDGAALTTLRTPATTALAVRHAAAASASRAVVFGTGVQAHAHIEALQAVMNLVHLDVVGRSTEKVQAVAETAESLGVSARVSGPEAVAEADVVVCCTASPEPLFDSGLLKDHATVAAIGSHDPHHRETDSALAQRSAVIVESRSSAQREAGDLIIPATEGSFDWGAATTLKDLVTGRAELPPDIPRFFKGTGMPWQDLSVVAGIYALKRRK